MKYKGKFFVALGLMVGYKAWYIEHKIKNNLPKNQISVDGNERKSAIIIGAGVAGVTTAYMLRKRGYNVLVLDSSNSSASECSACPAGSISKTTAMFNRDSWMDVFRSWNPLLSQEQSFFHIKWSKTLSDPHFWRWILLFSYYSIINSESQEINRQEMQTFTYFAIDRMLEVIKEHAIEDEVGLNDKGIVYTHYEDSNHIHEKAKGTSNTKSFQRVYKDEIYKFEKFNIYKFVNMQIIYNF